ncbi:MAG: DDE-type integrase/transposase/recombinase, partial [Pseudomonadota bacterium]
KMLTVLDEFTRQALAVTVRTRMGANDVLEVLYPLLLKHGSPEYIRSDNGPEFAAEAMQAWPRRVGIKPIRIYPGSPWENGYNENFLAQRAIKPLIVSVLPGRSGIDTDWLDTNSSKPCLHRFGSELRPVV